MAQSAPFSYRMPDKLRTRLEEHGRRNQRNLTQTITYLLLRALDTEEAPQTAHAQPAQGTASMGITTIHRRSHFPLPSHGVTDEARAEDHIIGHGATDTAHPEDHVGGDQE